MVIPEQSPYLEHHQAAKLIKPAPSSKPFSDRFQPRHFEDQFNHAKQINRSPSVAKFSQHPRSTTSSSQAEAQAEVQANNSNHLATGNTLPAAAATHHEALSRLIGQMPPANIPSTTSAWGRGAAVIGAVIIMGGYVWLQNYPKLAIQSAGNKAGLSASMPGYVPSSYNLKQTNIQPGLVTLQFATPNQPGRLTIAQHRTDWDSTSLLDNFVAKQKSEYASVSNQGLTIYLFNQNQATWVNHGVWYSITGATRLSREQILKIAYSL